MRTGWFQKCNAERLQIEVQIYDYPSMDSEIDFLKSVEEPGYPIAL